MKFSNFLVLTALLLPAITNAAPELIEMKTAECRSVNVPSSGANLDIGKSESNNIVERCVRVTGNRGNSVYKCATSSHPNFNNPGRTSLQYLIFEDTNKLLRFGTVSPAISDTTLNLQKMQFISVTGASFDDLGDPFVSICRGTFTIK